MEVPHLEYKLISEIDELIQHYKIVLIERNSNQVFIKQFVQAGINVLETIKAVWVVIKNRPLNIETDRSGKSGWILIWKDIPLMEVLNQLELEPRDIHFSRQEISEKRVYVKFKYLKDNPIIIISLHLSKED